MRYVYGIIFFFLLSLVVGCAPNVAIQTSSFASFSAPTFAGATQTTLVILNYNDSVIVNGECSSFSSSLKYSSDGGINWLLATTGSDLDCSDGTFSFTISDCSTIGLTAGSPLGTQIPLLLRSEGMLGTSNNSTVRIQLGVGFFPGLAGVRSGAGVMAGTQFKINSKIGSVQSLNTMVGSLFQIRTNKDF